MTIRRSIICLLGTLLGVGGSGCVVVVGGGWCVGCSRATTWTEPATEQIAFDGAGLSNIDVRTHNGKITFNGQSGGSNESSVIVTKKGGGLTPDAAQAAFDAIEVYVERTGGDTQRIGWKWRGFKRPTWSARVSFEVTAPGQTNLMTETHNGAVTITGAVGDVHAETHNGPLNIEAGAGKLYAETHNGKIVATYSGRDITLATHNGAVSVDLADCVSVAGDISTHNGGVEIIVGEKTSTVLDCRTHNGSIRAGVEIRGRKVSRRRLTGTIGTGNGRLTVTTHNGSVRIRNAAG